MQLTIESDQSEEAKELARRSPDTRAAPIILIIVGAIAVTELLQMIKELLRQVYYGRNRYAVTTTENMIFVIDTEGKTSRFTNDQFSLDVLKLALKVK